MLALLNPKIQNLDECLTCTHNVVWRDAGLSTIDEFAPSNSMRQRFHINAIIDDHRTKEHVLSLFKVLCNRVYLFPPSSSVTGVRCSAAARMITLPTGVEPV